VPLDDVEIATGVGVSNPSPVVEVPLGIFLGCIVSIVILIVWYTTNHWIVVNFIGFCMAITALSSLRCVVAFAYTYGLLDTPNLNKMNIYTCDYPDCKVSRLPRFC
jgi:hypothetical protein